MKNIALFARSLVLLCMGTLFVTAHAQETATAPEASEPSAEALADTIRDFNEAFGDVVEGEMTPAQIAQFEQMIAPAFEPDQNHRALCAAVSYEGVGTATIYAMAQANPALGEQAAELRAEIRPGSLRDWLVTFSASMIRALGYERTRAATNSECLQKKYVFALYPNVPMSSQEMLELEAQCQANDNC
ncbi:MAG: hypothetical protein AAF004_01320 [Pseudomonadota bacterium]